MSKSRPKKIPFQPWYLLVLAIISGVICLQALRSNNLRMNDLRDAVYAADSGNGDVQGALKELQAYVTNHMNTDLSVGKTPIYPPIQLKYTYERLKASQATAYAKRTNIYSDAQAYCEAQNSRDFSGRNRVPCIEQYVQSHSTTALPTIPDSLYKFAFNSPRWSPDLAGWSLAATATLTVAFVLSLLYRRLS